MSKEKKTWRERIATMGYTSRRQWRRVFGMKVPRNSDGERLYHVGTMLMTREERNAYTRQYQGGPSGNAGAPFDG